MKSAYDFDLLLEYIKKRIGVNIKIGEILAKILPQINDQLLNETIEEVKEEVISQQFKGCINTEAKVKHILNMLEKVKNRKYNFRRQNIEEGEKLNAFYKETHIELPFEEKKYPCKYCGRRSFTTNASLHSHYRSCAQFKQQGSQGIDPSKAEKENRKGMSQGFRKIPSEENGEKQSFARKVPVEIISLDKSEPQEQKRESQNGPKRSYPHSMIFESDIFIDQE